MVLEKNASKYSKSVNNNVNIRVYRNKIVRAYREA